MQSQNEYVPGTCNIGPAEVKRRKGVTIFSLVLTVLVLGFMLYQHSPRHWRLLLFIPVASLAVNFQQVYFKFCVNFGLRGIFNFDDAGRFDTIEQAEYRKKDRSKAVRMIISGLVVGLIAALIFYFLPF